MDFIDGILISVVCGACSGVFFYINSKLDAKWQVLQVMGWGLLVVVVGVSVLATLVWGIEKGGVILLLGGLAVGFAYRQRLVS